MNTQIIVNHDDKTVTIAQTGLGGSGDHRIDGPFEDITEAFAFVERFGLWMVMGGNPLKIPKSKNIESKIGSKVPAVDAPSKVRRKK